MSSDTKTSNREKLRYWRPENLHIGNGTEYDDDTWEGEVPAGSQAKLHQIQWAKAADAPFDLTHPKNRNLYEELKCLVWTLYNDRASAVALESGSSPRLSVGIKALSTWMLETGLTSLSQITNQLSWSYLEWFRDNWARPKIGKHRERLLSFGPVWNALKILTDAFDQVIPMQERGYEVMKEPPFDGLSAFNLAYREFDLRPPKKLDPIPDAIATPILTAAIKWVVERSDDIIALQDLWHRDVINLANSPQKALKLEQIATNFRFSIDPDTNRPWTSLDSTFTRIDSDGIERNIFLGDGPRRLVSDLVSACIIVTLGLTGMRASDIASIEVEPDQELPSCVSMKRSLDGLTEYFVLQGVEQKSSHEPHSWVLGARLSSTEEMPLPVRAIATLSRLLAAYRKANGVKRLVLTFSEARSMDPQFVGNMSASWLTNTQREFALNHAKVLLKKHTRKQTLIDHFAFRSQQWRDTFAVFVVRTNKRALGPLATHFNHVNTMMTELGYIGNDPELLGLLDDARLTLASNTIMAMMDENAPLAGGLSVLLRDAAEELREETKDLDKEEQLEKIKAIVLDYGIRLHFTDYGICGVGITPAISRCHQVAGDESLVKRFPNFATRRPGLCAGCKHFLVTMENLPYWKERTETLEARRPSKREERLWVHERELVMSRQILKTMTEAHDASETEKA
jgi:hypothetical protein